MNEIKHVTTLRESVIKMGLEAELAGYRLTAKAPRCFKIIKTEYKIPVKPYNKIAAYVQFCEATNQVPKMFELQPDGKTYREVR